MFGDLVATVEFLGSYINAPELKAPQGTLAPGSRNFLTFGQGHMKPFLGLNPTGNGARCLFQVKNTYGGLGDSGGNAAGSLFSHIASTLGFIGNGQVSISGTDIPGATASSTLKLLLSRNGSYTDPLSGPYAAGLSAPSAPVVAVLDAPGVGFAGLLEGAYSIVLVRVRSTTGAISVRSLTSAVIVAAKQTVRVTFPSASTGQDYWLIYATQAGFGGIGPHYRLIINGNLQVSEATVAAGIVDGVARSLELEWQTGDLVQEEAPIDDYPPPAGTHAFALENVWAVGGCYSDATALPLSSSPGTCIAVSLKNRPESYKPTDLLYLPEQILSVLQRPSESYVYIGCRNSIHAVQYTGSADGPALTITTIWSETGIANQHGWCQINGIIFAFTAKGKLVTIGAMGQPDDSFAKEIREDIKGWDPATTVVGHDPDSQSLIVSNGITAFALNMQENSWSAPINLASFQTGNSLSCVTAGGSLKLALDNAGTHSLYTWNVGAGSDCSAISQWEEGPDGPKSLRAYKDKFYSDNTNTVFISIHGNLRKTAVDDATITTGTNILDSNTALFTADDVGKYVLVFGAGAAGGPLLAKIQGFTSTTRVTLDQNAGTTVANAYATIARYIYQRVPRVAANTFRPKRWLVRDLEEFAVGIHFRAQSNKAQPTKVKLYGSANDVSTVKASK